MTKISPLTNVLFLLIAIVFCVIPQCLAALSDKQLCYDPNCSEVISLARTIIAYNANDREIMSFGINEDVKVFSKGAGKRTDLWGVEIKGKRGFAPKSFLKEHKVLQRILSYEVPVYKFIDEVENKVQTKTEKVHKVHPLLKDKLPHDDNETLSSSEKSLDKSIQEENVESKKLESTGEIDEKHSSTKDDLSRDNNETPLQLAQSVDETVPKIETTNVDSILPSYEVIDGTTFYFESKPSIIQQNFATEGMHATALPNEQASLPLTNSKTDSDKDGKVILINEKVMQHDINNFNNKPEEIKLSPDIPEETNTNTLLENSDVIINPTIDTIKKDDTLLHDGSSKFTDNPSKNLENDKLIDSSAEKNTENKEEEPTENIESEGIFASFARTFNILSDSLETTTTESTTSPNDNDLSTSKVTIESKSTVVKENNPVTETLSSIDPSITNKDDTEIQQETIHESIQITEFSNEKIKPEEGKIVVPLENAASRDVPSSSNFVHEDASKPAQDLPIASSVLVNDSSVSKETDSSNAENIKTQEIIKEEKVIENIETEGTIASLVGELISSNMQETTTTKSISTESNDDIMQTSSEGDKAYSENAKKDIHKETIVQMGNAAIDETSKTINLLPAENTLENITKEALSDSPVVEEGTVIIDDSLNRNAANIQLNTKSIVHSNVNKNDNLVYDASSDNVPIESNEFSNGVKSSIVSPEQSADSSQKDVISEEKWAFGGYLRNRNLASVKENIEHRNVENQIHNSVKSDDNTLPEYGDHINSEDKVLLENEDIKGNNGQDPKSTFISHEIEVTSDNVCSLDHECTTENIVGDNSEPLKKVKSEEDYMIDVITIDHNYWKTLMYLVVTSLTILVFTLGYYYIENIRRDGQLIAKINKLEKELLVSTKECEVLSEDLKSTKKKLHCIEDESFGSNEMVVSLKADLEASQTSKTELEDQVAMLEKDLESATEAGLELERMLREVLSSNNEVNPLAQSVEDLQARLDAQQAANESLTNALNLKSQEIETLSTDFAAAKKKCEELEVEVSHVQEELDSEKNLKNNIEQTFTDKVHSLEVQVNELSSEKSSLYKELRGKEIEVKELVEVINQVNSNNLDLEKLYDVSHIKTEAIQLREERDELKMRLNDVEGAHELLEEHMKMVKEETAALSEQCKIAEKEKKDAETRLEVLSKFFKEKEAERQKEEAIWLQKQGEVVSTVERLHTMQNEIQNYKQQTEMLKREIVDQEREYKNQISALETRSHEQWVVARQNERRMEEMRAEAGQLRNRLTLAEKNLNDSDSETKLHRLEANGETATSPSLFIGAESSSSPVMFSSGVPPPPPPSYLHCFPPPVLPLASGFVRTQYDSLSQRPPPLGGRLSSPPPMPPLHPPAPGGRYENASSPPPPMSPHLLPSFNRHRSPPPPPFGGDHIPPFPPPGSIVPLPIGTPHTWGEESLPLLRSSGFHPHQREQRARNHKGSLHSSGESLDKAHHGKV